MVKTIMARNLPILLILINVLPIVHSSMEIHVLNANYQDTLAMNLRLVKPVNLN